MFRSTKQWLIVLAIAAFLLASCGGGSGADSSPTDAGASGEAVDNSTADESGEAADEVDELVETTPTVDTDIDGTTTDGEAEPEAATVVSDERFTIQVVSAYANGPAGAEPHDMDGDGDLDLVVNSFGDRGENPGPVDFPPGGVSIYWNEGDGVWAEEAVFTPDDGIYFPNEALPKDLDGDGDEDILVSAGFFVCEFNREVGPCGGLFWLENTADGWVQRDIVPLGDPGFYHRVDFTDLDGDNIDDMVTVAEYQADAQAQWFKGTGEGDQWETTPRMIGQGGGSLPVLHDIDGDGDLDLGSGEFFFEGASYMWFEQVEAPSEANPDGVWQRHDMVTSLGRSIQLSVIPDLFGDGVARWIGSNHENTQPGEDGALPEISLITPGDDPRELWSTEAISEGIISRPTEGTAFQAAPGVFSWGDVDDDGDIDLLVSGDGDARIFWFEQTAPGEFDQHVIAENFGQAAGGAVADLDGDGDNETIFTSYDTHEVLIFDLTP